MGITAIRTSLQDLSKYRLNHFLQPPIKSIYPKPNNLIRVSVRLS